MASLGHIAIGMAVARTFHPESQRRRASLTAMLLWSALSFLPDADVIGFGFGVRYADEWGHRGATHSFVFSCALGAAIGLLAPLFRLPAARTGLTASLVLASHALLDTLTNGGLGCALFWPFDLTRYFAPWTPIPVAPIGLSFFSPYGLFVAMAELVFFAPLLWFALTSRSTADARTDSKLWWRPPALLIGMWLVGVWLVASTDPIRERIVRFVLRDDTEFKQDFSEERLDSVERGQAPQEVRERLGAPLHEFLLYESRPDSCAFVRIQGDAVVRAQPADPCRMHGVRPGVSRAAVQQAPGPPREACWLYSRSPDKGYYRARAVCFTDGRVTGVIRRWLRE
jgi:inner membrane protein